MRQPPPGDASSRHGASNSLAFSLFCLVHLERAKARAAESYQGGLRWRWVQEERRRRELRRDAALTLWKAAW